MVCTSWPQAWQTPSVPGAVRHVLAVLDRQRVQVGPQPDQIVRRSRQPSGRMSQNAPVPIRSTLATRPARSSVVDDHWVVRCSSLPTSGWAWMSRRRSISRVSSWRDQPGDGEPPFAVCPLHPHDSASVFHGRPRAAACGTVRNQTVTARRPTSLPDVYSSALTARTGTLTLSRIRLAALPRMSLPTRLRRRRPITIRSAPVSRATDSSCRATSRPSSSCRSSVGTGAEASSAASSSRASPARTDRRPGRRRGSR